MQNCAIGFIYEDNFNVINVCNSEVNIKDSA